MTTKSTSNQNITQKFELSRANEEQLIPPFIREYVTNMSEFNLNVTRRPDGKIEFDYKLVFDEKNKNGSNVESSTISTTSTTSTTRSNRIKSSEYVHDLIHVYLILCHYADNKMSSSKKSKFTHEFLSSCTIREVLSEFFDEFKSKVKSKHQITPRLSYFAGKPDEKKQAIPISSLVIDRKIGGFAENQENLTIFVNVTEKKEKMK